MLKSDTIQTVVFAFILIGLGYVGRGCYDNASSPSVIDVKTMHRADTATALRPDSQKIKLSLVLPRSEFHGKANRSDTITYKDTPVELIAGIDTVGFFGKDSSQITPDSASIRYNFFRNEFALEYSFGLRNKDTVVKYFARDSIITIRDSTTITEKTSMPFLEKATYFLTGVAVPFLLKAIFHF